MRVSSTSQVKGPMYRCFINSLCSISSKALLCARMEGLLGGVKYRVMVGACTWKLCINCSSRVGCLCDKLNAINNAHQPSVMYGIMALLGRHASSAPMEGALLGSMIGVDLPQHSLIHGS
jgi:hypothetical protein